MHRSPKLGRKRWNGPRKSEPVFFWTWKSSYFRCIKSFEQISHTLSLWDIVWHSSYIYIYIYIRLVTGRMIWGKVGWPWCHVKWIVYVWPCSFFYPDTFQRDIHGLLGHFVGAFCDDVWGEECRNFDPEKLHIYIYICVCVYTYPCICIYIYKCFSIRFTQHLPICCFPPKKKKLGRESIESLWLWRPEAMFPQKPMSFLSQDLFVVESCFRYVALPKTNIFPENRRTPKRK